MIYIKRFNLCFIRIPKNASSSAMHFIYHNMCEDEDVVSRMYEWNDDHIEKLYYKNCPKLPHSHVDAKYVVENDIVPSDAHFIGVIREPIERFLSLYLYRIRDGEYGPILPTPKHFQSLFDGGVFRDTPQQIQKQSTFLPENGEYWLYEDVEYHLHELCNRYNVEVKHPLQRLNKSPGETKKLIKHFFTEQLIESIRQEYAEDFELYERLLDVSLKRQH